MPDTREPRSLIEAAEQAANAGDYTSAERLLREAADSQEATLGHVHPDLANTLNNLGVVCELADHPEEAERCFRRAYQIAVNVFEPDHPFVRTSRKNLEDFCAANGKSFEEIAPRVVRPIAPEPPPAPLITDLLLPPPNVADLPLAPPAAPERPPAPRTPPDIPRQPAMIEAAAPRASSRLLAIGLIVAALIFAVVLARSLFFRQPVEREAASAPQSEASPPAVATPPTTTADRPPETKPKPAERAAEPKPAERPPEPKPKDTAPSKAAPPPVRPSAPVASKSALSVVSAQVCRSLRTGGDWRCDAAGSPAAVGQLFFYTRVKSPSATVVQHRWYRGDQLRKSVDLDISANPGSGYRTYSRNTVDSGEWRVELRARDGALLQEERFTVR